MPTETIILWILYAIMFLMSPIGAIIVQIKKDKEEKQKKEEKK